MNKPLIKLITLLLSTTLVTACQKPTGPSSNKGSGGNDSHGYDVSDNSETASSDPDVSGDNSDTSGEDLPDESVDGFIKAFLNGTNVAMPALKSFEESLVYDALYYYAYESYFISISANDNGAVVNYLNNQLPGSSGLTSLNDDTYYPVAEYGYMWGDSSTGSINVYLEYSDYDGYSLVSLYRYDGETGTLDVSNVDTSWYVDYINFQGLTLFDYFPSNEIKDELDLELSLPSFNADVYPNAFVPAYTDSDGSYPNTFYIVLEGSQVTNYATMLDNAGFITDIQHNIGEEFDWDTLDYVEYDYYTATAYDADHSVFIQVTPDESGNTLIIVNRFEDVRTDKKTTDTDWDDISALLMEETLKECIPFMAFGEDYAIYDESDEEYDVLCLYDTYYESLADEYIAILLANGYKEDSTSYTSTCYYYDNGEAYIEIFVDYYDGNYLEIYFEDSKLTPATDISLNANSVYIVSGASYQLSYSCYPEGSFAKVTWSSSNEDLATVDQNGLVTINSEATAGQKVSIYATTSTDIKVGCEFQIQPNEVSNVWVRNATVIPGGEKVQLRYGLSPQGVTQVEDITFAIEGDGLHVDQNGNVWADDTAVPGTTGTVTITYGSGATALENTATITVASREVRHTLTRDFFGIEKANYSKYLEYTKTVDGATYTAMAAGNNGIQIRSKSNDSGIVAHMDGRNCASITFTFDSNTYGTRVVDIYGSNESFDIEDMFGSSITKVGSVSYTQGGQATFTYTFTEKYSYIGFRSNDGAIYFNSIEVVWR